MRQARRIFLLLLVSIAISGCTHDAQPNMSNNQEPLAETSIVVTDTEKEEASNVIVELCQVKSIQEDSFTISNAKEEIYRIDNSYLGGLKIDDHVVLEYRSRTPLGDNEYSVDVCSLYLNRLSIPH